MLFCFKGELRDTVLTEGRKRGRVQQPAGRGAGACAQPHLGNPAARTSERRRRHGVSKGAEARGRKGGGRRGCRHLQGGLAGPGQTHRVSVFSPTSQLSWLARLATDSWQTPSRHSIQTDSLVCEQPNSGAAKREQKECQAAGCPRVHTALS